MNESLARNRHATLLLIHFLYTAPNDHFSFVHLISATWSETVPPVNWNPLARRLPCVQSVQAELTIAVQWCCWNVRASHFSMCSDRHISMESFKNLICSELDICWGRSTFVEAVGYCAQLGWVTKPVPYLPTDASLNADLTPMAKSQIGNNLPFDSMGAGYIRRHLHNYHKARIGHSSGVNWFWLGRPILRYLGVKLIDLQTLNSDLAAIRSFCMVFPTAEIHNTECNGFQHLESSCKSLVSQLSSC